MLTLLKIKYFALKCLPESLVKVKPETVTLEDKGPNVADKCAISKKTKGANEHLYRLDKFFIFLVTIMIKYNSTL